MDNASNQLAVDVERALRRAGFVEMQVYLRKSNAVIQLVREKKGIPAHRIEEPTLSDAFTSLVRGLL